MKKIASNLNSFSSHHHHHLHPHHQQPDTRYETLDDRTIETSKMFTRFDTNKSTKGASKLRRDLINAEIANLRDLLPLPQSTRQRLSQLQLMALVCVYVRKANYFQQVFKRHEIAMHQTPTPNIGFSKALSGFLMMLTQNGKLLYISDNAAEYLGHSMEDLLIHGDSVYDIIDKQDHGSIQAELSRTIPQQTTGSGSHHSPISNLEGEQRMFLCRMNVSRNARRQMRFGDQKVVLVQGHYLSYLPLCSRNEPVFLATCTPIAMPETRECIVQGATNVFTTIHSMDMKIIHMDKNGEFHIGYTKNELQGISWYHLLHWDSTREAQTKHRLITQSEQDRSCILLVQMQRRCGDFIWVHTVLQVRDSQDNNQQPVIVCTNQVLSDREATVMYANSWLYHYYSIQSKIQFGIPYEGPARVQPATTPYIHPHIHHTNHHHHHHHSPTTVESAIGHPYVTSNHMSPYGYHSPVPQHQASPGLVNHYNNGTPQLQYHNAGEPYRPYAYRIDTQPVDYSSAIGAAGELLTITNGDTNSPNENGSPPVKRRALARLEPLYISDNQHDSSSDTSIGDTHTMPTSVGDGGSSNSNSGVGNGGGGTVILTAVGSLRHSQLHIKAMHSNETHDFMDQWNPSPPWSETTQKVPDIVQQELSPYLARTPPTPTSAPTPANSTNGGAAFTFDWMPEQFVPSMDGNAIAVGQFMPIETTASASVMPIQLPLQISHWPTPPPQPVDQKFYSLQPIGDRHTEDDARDIREERRSH